MELDFNKSAPQTEFPGLQSWLPLQLKVDNHPELPMSPASSNASPTDEDIFECPLHVVSLLDLILRTTQSVSEANKDSVLSELTNLDIKLRNYLEVMMIESSQRQNTLCNSVALSIRYGALRRNTCATANVRGFQVSLSSSSKRSPYSSDWQRRKRLSSKGNVPRYSRHRL